MQENKQTKEKSKAEEADKKISEQQKKIKFAPNNQELDADEFRSDDEPKDEDEAISANSTHGKIEK